MRIYDDSDHLTSVKNMPLAGMTCSQSTAAESTRGCQECKGERKDNIGEGMWREYQKNAHYRSGFC
jgi:hypothetical protein